MELSYFCFALGFPSLKHFLCDWSDSTIFHSHLFDSHLHWYIQYNTLLHILLGKFERYLLPTFEVFRRYAENRQYALQTDRFIIPQPVNNSTTHVSALNFSSLANFLISLPRSVFIMNLTRRLQALEVRKGLASSVAIAL